MIELKESVPSVSRHALYKKIQHEKICRNHIEEDAIMIRSAFATPISLATLLVGLLVGSVTPTLAADSSLVDSPVAPCRIFDTRNTGGPIAAGTSEDFYVYGDAATMFAQGGNPAGCPAPQGEPIAVHLNITVVPLGDGHIRVYPKDSPLPNASTVNYTNGVNIANAVTLKTKFDTADPADADISVYSANNANVLADVEGYYYPKLKNVITVSAEYADFTNPIDAINSIPTTGPNAPSATNPYVIQIGPGTYDLGSNQLIMREWVDIKGTGSREATVLTGAVSAGSYANAALFVSANNTELTDLTIINTGGGPYSIAIFNNATSPKIRRIKTRVSGSTYNYSIHNYNNAAASLSNVNAKASGGFTAAGILNSSSSTSMKEVTVEVSGASDSNYGIVNTTGAAPSMNNVTVTALGSGVGICRGFFNSTASPEIYNVIITASGCDQNYGIYNYEASPLIINGKITASNGSLTRGIYNYSNCNVTIRSSIVEGASNSIRADATSTAKVSYSTLIGGTSEISDYFSCIYVVDENNNPLDANCQPVP